MLDARFGELTALVEEASREDLPALAGRLREAELLVELRLREGGAQRPVETPSSSTWITPDAAARVAGVSKKRIYEWAKGKRWASRPTRRCLRIEEAAFRGWLERRK